MKITHKGVCAFSGANRYGIYYKSGGNEIIKSRGRESIVLSSSVEEISIGSVIYCPACKAFIEADNLGEVASKEHDGYLFIHSEAIHYDDDIQALSSGIQ